MTVEPIQIRNFLPGDAAALRAVFHAAVHGLACRDYAPDQLNAWAPLEHDAALWAACVQSNQSFVAERVVAKGATEIAGFADLQADGYIDHFFVAPAHAGQGVAHALMAHIHTQAAQRGITRLWADVSLTAEPFFVKSGFTVEARQQVECQGVVLWNARMVKASAIISYLFDSISRSMSGRSMHF